MPPNFVQPEIATDVALALDPVEPLKEPHIEPAPVRVALLGCGMMGREHLSYLAGYPHVHLDFVCDPHEASRQASVQTWHDYHAASCREPPQVLADETMLLDHVKEIDLLVIATPNYLHTDMILRWSQHDITILVEKPVAVSQAQVDQLKALVDPVARIWVAMEYRFIPNVAKLLSLREEIGDIRMVTIRENRYPFLHKVQDWNRDAAKTGDTLVEKCCHFFDLFRLITGQEAVLSQVQAMAQRGINYQDEDPATFGSSADKPIIDAAYVMFPMQEEDGHDTKKPNTMACLELCMYAEGSRHQEEIVVTGTQGRLEATSPENKVYLYKRPDAKEWSNRHEPPPKSSIHSEVIDCSEILSSEVGDLPSLHGGYHYGSTAVEWFQLLNAMQDYRRTGKWRPLVSLSDGYKAVEIGLQATSAIAGQGH